MCDEYVITQYGDTALMRAARYCESEAVVELVKAGANVNLQNNVCHCIYVGYWPSITKISKYDILPLS